MSIHGRYSVMSSDFYIPEKEHVQPQSKQNKQGRAGQIDSDDVEKVRTKIKVHSNLAYEFYEDLLNENVDSGAEFSEDFPGIARESARMVLPVNNYTEWYWQANLHNIFHFINLRADSHAQYEIQIYAKAMLELIRPIVPIATEAFKDYIQNAVNLSAMEKKLVENMMNNVLFSSFTDEDIQKKYNLTKRELTEFKEKFSL